MMNSNLPFFSVIVPTYCRPQALSRCLRALSLLDYPQDRYEVIVVNDDLSPLNPSPRWTHGVRLVFLTQLHGGPAKARNTGAAQAKGDYLAFTDDDCEPEPSWLRSLAASLANTSDAAIGGHTVNGLLDNPYSQVSQMLIDYVYKYYNSDPQNAAFVTTNNFACPARQFRALGGFNPTFSRAAAEDREFCDRWRHHGLRIIYTPDARVIHRHRLTLRGFWRQHFHYGMGAFAFHQIRAELRNCALSVEPVGFYLNLLQYSWTNARGVKQPLVLGLMGMTQLANALGFFSARRRFHQSRRSDEGLTHDSHRIS